MNKNKVAAFKPCKSEKQNNLTNKLLYYALYELKVVSVIGIDQDFEKKKKKKNFSSQWQNVLGRVGRSTANQDFVHNIIWFSIILKNNALRGYK